MAEQANAAVAQPANVAMAEPANAGLASLLRPLARGQLRPALAGAALLVVASAVHLTVPLVLARVVDAAVGRGAAAQLDGRALLLVAIAVAQALLAFGANVLLRVVAERITLALRGALFRRLLALPLPFHQRARTGELAAATTNDVAALQQLLAAAPAQALPAPLIIIGSLALMLRQSVTLTLVIAAAVPLMVVTVRALGARIRDYSAAAQAAIAGSSATLQEALTGIETVQASGNEALHAARYDADLSQMYRARLRHAVAESAFGAAIGLVAFGAFAGAFWLGGRLVIRGELTGGALVALLAYATYLQGAVNSLTQLVGSLQSARGALARPAAILATPLPAEGTVAPAPAARLRGDLVIDDVSFRHEGRDEHALDGVTLHVPVGTICAVTGPSGAGKTTLARLLLRFYDLQRGTIRIGGVDIASVSVKELRRSLAYVAQEPLMFSGTIRDNIRYGRRDATDEEVEAAARAAYAHDFIAALPAGYDTHVGERGATFSGGQRQRIVIARAVLADPALLVLDEPTSALDDVSERYVQQALERLRAGRVTIIIAHRPTTIARADMVAVLDGGRLLQPSAAASA